MRCPCRIFRITSANGLESSASLATVPTVLIETSRGCWWGDRDRHFMFCGLNGATMAYRSKSGRSWK